MTDTLAEVLHNVTNSDDVSGFEIYRNKDNSGYTCKLRYGSAIRSATGRTAEEAVKNAARKEAV